MWVVVGPVVGHHLGGFILQARFGEFSQFFDGHFRVLVGQVAELVFDKALAQLVDLVDKPAVVNDGPYRAGDLQRSVLDPAVMVSILGAPTPLGRGLTATTDWFRDQAQLP